MMPRPLRIAIDGGDKICQPCPSPFCQTRDASAFIKLHGPWKSPRKWDWPTAIVDLADSGDSLRVNGLIEREKIMDVSAMFIINRAAARRHRLALATLQKRFAKAVGDA